MAKATARRCKRDMAWSEDAGRERTKATARGREAGNGRIGGGDHVMTTIDGEVVEDPDVKLIGSDRTNGPDAQDDGAYDREDERAYDNSGRGR